MKIPEYTDSFILAPGFRAAGVHAGIKADPQKSDMALIVSDREDTVAAGMFTTNKFQAAPVVMDIQKLKKGTSRAIIVNSGNANACTGAQGKLDAEEMAQRTADRLALPVDQVLVSSTGSIGKPMKMDPVRKGIDLLTAQLDPKGGNQAAAAIMTTDTRPKTCSTVIEIDGVPVTMGGCCKGAGMIEPNMATMLAYICTDATIDTENLRQALKVAVDTSFNKISIDGDTSTNDSVICLANAHAPHNTLTPQHPDWEVFQTALNGVLFDLAMKIVWDGEGMTKFIELRAEGAVSDADADKALRAIANSFLVKTGWAGTYPAWSRMVDVLGYCDVEIDTENINIHYDDIPMLIKSTPASPDTEALTKILNSNRYTVHLNLGTGGEGTAVLYTCDCTEEYVRINMF
ncbi:bifunctional glutamate N-acetyltransferase/amino-acid acetyltransferase ArgJ [Kiritimatiellota bacterium B12222]|nr:bifunctional glutamate N-acetyltransferase/amino-acid acetyltransferase ArgJ [Kiritimatiellota bacterium B12222]